MPDSTVIPLRPRVAAAYTDTPALNDIHALLTTTEPGQSTLADIALILARTGRPMTRARDIEVSTIETALGWPVALVKAGDTNVYVRQDPACRACSLRSAPRTTRGAAPSPSPSTAPS